MANLGNTIVNGALRVNGKINSSDVISAPSFVGALTGNADTATKLKTARTINGTSFDGSGNITTANWGTARNIGIVNSDGTGTAVTVSVNGSGNINLKLPATIKAALTGNAATATKLATARTINGVSFDGSANITVADSTKLPLAGGTLSGDLNFSHAGSGNPASIGWNTGTIRQRIRIFDEGTTDNDVFEFQQSRDSGGTYATLMAITANNKVKATTFVGALSGNASSATKLQTAHTIGVSGVTGTAQSFDGTNNIIIPITAVPATLLTNKSSIKGSEITDDKHWVPSNDASVTNFVAMSTADFILNSDNLATGTVIAVTDGDNGYITTQATSLVCDLPLDL